MAEPENTDSIASTGNESISMDEAEVTSASIVSSTPSPDSVATDSPSTISTQDASAIETTTISTTNEEAKVEETEKMEDDKSKDKEAGEENKKKKPKPRVVKEKIHGIYTIQQLESANFLVEWYKGFRASAPYLVRLTKTYYSLSPTYTVALVGANLLKAILPSLNLWVRKEFLDQVQRAAEGKSVRARKMMMLLALRLLDLLVKQGLELLTDKVDTIMERRLGRVLDKKLVEAYLKLDEDQLTSKKVGNTFSKAKSFANRNPAQLIVQWIQLFRYTLTIVTSTFTLTRLMSVNARQLLLLNAVRMAANIYRLALAYSEAVRYRVQNKAWHRLNLMKGFSLNEKLRRDITITGIESWLTAEMDTANEQLGDIPTRPPWHGRASSSISFARHLISNCIESAEYLWLVYHGLKKGISLGTLQLIRSSAMEVMDQLWGLSYTADNATEEWKNLLAFYKILEVKSEIKLPDNPVEYVSSPNGMKIEAKEIRYKYDMKSEEEVLKGTSFVINPGEMIAVVGFNGAGKSTLAKLLTRLANVTGGQLLINDIDVKDYDPADLRRHTAVLFQDIGQYQGLTILENIGVGKVSDMQSESIVQQSATDAGAAEFIDALPYKYNSILGYRPGERSYGWGVGRWDDSDSDSDDDETEDKDIVQKNLSGGQWQKIALARSFMRGTEADLLVLDEPTANLDPEAEYKLFETIKRLRKGRTTVYISHRFNTVRAADRIMVMEKGEVKEFGTHEELMALKDGRYHRLYTLQAKGFQLADDGKVSKDVDGMIVDVKEEVVEQVIEIAG